MTLNLDSIFNPFNSNDLVQFESFTFYGGEPHIKILSPQLPASVNITHRLNSFNDFGLLCVAVDALRRMGCRELNLFIPYFPAARQDRVMIGGEPLTVKVYADIINQMRLNSVTVFDPHSEVTPALLDNCKVITNAKLAQLIKKDIANDFFLVSPDGGALKKIYKVSNYLGGMEVIECSKSRDVKTGQLSGFKVGAQDLAGRDCLVLDDICDGGGTFNGLAKELKNKNAGNLYLAVSHGIFNKGFDELLKSYSRIYTTDSVREINHPNVKQIKFSDGLLS